MSAKTEPADILISFDTTGSMYPCLTQVRRVVEQTTKDLFKELQDLRIGIITHGDYCDGPNFISFLDLTTNQVELCNFIKKAPETSGGDAPEAYEAVLNKARYVSWKPDRVKALVLIGDDIPHGKNEYQNKNKFDWKAEAQALVSHGVSIYAVQALSRGYANTFYEGLADISGTPKLELNQFGQVTELLQAICYKQSNRLPEFEALLRAKATERIDFSLLNNIDKLAGRVDVGKYKNTLYTTKRKDGLEPVNPSRFQILRVDYDTPIKDFVQENGLRFKQGRGFYEFTKSVEVQEYKEVILQDRKTGEMFSGDAARKILGIPVGKRATVRPTFLSDYRGFIQSTSNNRKLLGGTNFLYEVEGY